MTLTTISDKWKISVGCNEHIGTTVKDVKGRPACVGNDHSFFKIEHSCTDVQEHSFTYHAIVSRTPGYTLCKPQICASRLRDSICYQGVWDFLCLSTSWTPSIYNVSRPARWASVQRKGQWKEYWQTKTQTGLSKMRLGYFLAALDVHVEHQSGKSFEFMAS